MRERGKGGKGERERRNEGSGIGVEMPFRSLKPSVAATPCVGKTMRNCALSRLGAALNGAALLKRRSSWERGGIAVGFGRLPGGASDWAGMR